MLDDYPGECYPIDVVAAVGLILRADKVLGTDHSAFAQRALRGFTGSNADSLGLPRFRVELPSGREVQPFRGIGTSWSLVFAPELWPATGARWYSIYERGSRSRRRQRERTLYRRPRRELLPGQMLAH